MIILGISLLVFIMLVFIVSSINKQKEVDLDDQRKELNLLIEKINHKRLELSKIDDQIINRSIDPSVNLSKVKNDVLNIYDQSGIKIPLDIVEELSFNNIDDRKQIFDFIENQRQYWILENRKKPYRRL